MLGLGMRSGGIRRRRKLWIEQISQGPRLALSHSPWKSARTRTKTHREFSMKENDGMPEASWKQNLWLICSIVSALSAVSALSIYFDLRPWNSGGQMPIGAPSPRHPSILWLVLAVVLMALNIGISLYDRRRFKKAISLVEERKRELEGQLTESDSRIAELENELMSYSHEVKISPY